MMCVSCQALQIMKKVFELHQKFAPLVNQYRVIEDDKLVGFASQKRLAMREKFTLYKDESKTQIVASSAARKIIDFGSAYDVYDEKDKKLAVIKKEFIRSLGTSTWLVYDAEMKKELYMVTEKNQGVAIFRRVWNFIPVLGDIPFILKFHFSIYRDDKIVGEYQKLSLWFDRYALFLDEAELKRLDQRVWMIMAVLQDALQGR